METTNSKGIILYADGGCRDGNPGNAGYGVHGYLYTTEPLKKVPGNPLWLVTDKGYILKANDLPASAKEVIPVHYIDGFGSFMELATNNVAELAAAINGLIHASDFDINSVQIYTDSEYVRTGLEEWVDTWKNNNWLKNDNTPPANVKYWKQLVDIRDRLTQRGVSVKISWIKGHSGNIGNDIADKLATIGVMASKQRKYTTEFTITAAEGYWKHDSTRHPLLSNPRMYFNTLVDYIRPGEYYLGNHGREDDLLGKRISDGTYALIRLSTPDPVLELIRNHQVAIAGITNSIIMARLDHLYRPSTYKELSTYGTLALEQIKSSRLDLACLDREPLTRELTPPKLAMNAVDSINELANKLDRYLSKDPQLIETDITDLLYEIETKTNKKGISTTTTKLKPEYNVGFAALPVTVNYKHHNGIATTPITITLGIDLLDRNALKNLESTNPTVKVITWLEAENVFRYATIVFTNDDVGIYCGFYSNMVIVPPST